MSFARKIIEDEFEDEELYRSLLVPEPPSEFYLTQNYQPDIHIALVHLNYNYGEGQIVEVHFSPNFIVCKLQSGEKEKYQFSIQIEDSNFYVSAFTQYYGIHY